MFSGGIETENWLKWIIFATKTIRLNDIFRGIEKRCEKTGLNFFKRHGVKLVPYTQFAC